MAAEFELLCRWELQHVLESLTNLHQVVAATCLSSGASPQTNSEEALSHVDNHTHDLLVALVLQGLTNRCKLCVKPELIDVDQLLVFERV